MAGKDPHTRLPLLYFALAHLCLASAFAALALQPQRFAAFFYHPRMVAVVHLITLGWISASILGALYMIAPMALRTRLPARPVDYAAWALYAIGVTGMVAHFWIDSPKGMVWSAGTVALALLWVSGRLVLALRKAPVPGAVKLHFVFAFLNLLAAATLGLLLGLNKVEPVLGGYVLSNVFAHAHLAALGWATMMVMGAGYRLLPMLLPAAMPEGRPVWGTAVLLEIGAFGLFVSFLSRSRTVALFAVVTAAALGLFFRQVLWMRRHPRPAPQALQRPDFGVLHAFEALAYLALALLLGLALAFTPAAEWKLRAALVYGLFGLVGFLAQMVVGVSLRLLPLYAWLRAYERTGFTEQPASPHATPARPAQAAGFLLWTAGVPLLAAGFAFDRLMLVSAGAGALFLAVVLGGLGDVLLFRRAGWPPTR
jgi:hypothetical protein